MMWKYKKVMQKKVEYVLKAAITGVALTYAFSGFLWNKRKELVQEWKNVHIQDDKMKERLRVMEHMKPMESSEVGFGLVGVMDLPPGPTETKAA